MSTSSIRPFDLSPLVTCELHTVVVARNFLILNFLRAPHLANGEFRKDASCVDVEAGFSLSRPNFGELACDQSTMLEAAGALAVALIDCEVSEASFSPSGDLLMRFTNESVLTIKVNESGFDCYHIHTPNGSTVASATSNPSFQRTATRPLN